jgi:hypothetical protein
MSSLPVAWNDIQPFVDVRNHIFNNGEYALNLGIGARFCDFWLGGAFGLNLYYDFLHWDHHDYHQVGFGVEFLDIDLCCFSFDFRLNTYFPVGDHSHCSCKNVFKFPGGFEVECQRCRKSLGGFDAEVGTCLNWCCSPCDTCCIPLDFYIAAGPYYYARDCGDDVYGGRVRLEASYCNFTLMLGTTYDSVFDGGVQVGLFFSLPLGDCCCPCFESVYRNEIIVLDHKRCIWETNF